ncbi:hypothetical protein [Micromonospora sp. DT41]|uniref:hypothetical protein n=1 Tax=Micromonospora sp. DT41 TaxID=3393437 RepID=UPI003CF0244F
MRSHKAHQGRLATLVVMGVLLSGCARQGQPEAADPKPPVTGTTVAAMPLAPEMLIGSWTLVDVADPGAGTILRLADTELHLIGSHCGTLGVSWRANDEGVSSPTSGRLPRPSSKARLAAGRLARRHLGGCGA